MGTKTAVKKTELGKFIKDCGSYMEASRRTGIFWLNLRRWHKRETIPCLANRQLLENAGLFVKP